MVIGRAEIHIDVEVATSEVRASYSGRMEAELTKLEPDKDRTVAKTDKSTDRTG